MPECTLCGRKSGFWDSAWIKCDNCKAWYCDKCKSRLKRAFMGPWECARCGGKAHG